MNEPKLRLPHGNAHAVYPLPPLMLGDIIADYSRMRNIPEPDIEVIEVTEGYGRHTHDHDCYLREVFDRDRDQYVMQHRPEWECMRDCDDSDWIVTISYKATPRGGHATYGVKDGKPDLWMD